MNDQDHASSRWMKPYLIAIIVLLALTLGLKIYELRDYKVGQAQGKSPVYDDITKLLNERKYEQVIHLCDAEIRKDPENSDAWWGKAQALYHLERWQESGEAFRKVQELRPAWSEPADRFLTVMQNESNATGRSEEGGGRPAPSPRIGKPE